MTAASRCRASPIDLLDRAALVGSFACMVHCLALPLLHQAEALLQRAHDDLAHEGDNPAARCLRNRAIAHVDDAGRLTSAAIGDQAF